MEIKFTLFALLICFNHCLAQEKGYSESKGYYPSGKIKYIIYGKDYHRDKETRFDEEGNITSELKHLDQSGSNLLSLYEKGKLSREVNFKKGKKEGICTGYYPSGRIKYNGNYANNLKIGEWNWYYESGNKSQVTLFEKDYIKTDSTFLRDGRFSFLIKHTFFSSKKELRTYYKEGIQKVGEVNFKENKLDGSVKRFYSNGKLKGSAGYKNGRMHGEWIYYTEQGELFNGIYSDLSDSGFVEWEGKCINGKAEGAFLKYNSDREVVIKANFKNGKPEGRTFYYNSGDKPVLIEEYSNGKFVKEEKE